MYFNAHTCGKQVNVCSQLLPTLSLEDSDFGRGGLDR